jgi:hypothetical protein
MMLATFGHRRLGAPLIALFDPRYLGGDPMAGPLRLGDTCRTSVDASPQWVVVPYGVDPAEKTLRSSLEA